MCKEEQIIIYNILKNINKTNDDKLIQQNIWFTIQSFTTLYFEKNKKHKLIEHFYQNKEDNNLLPLLKPKFKKLLSKSSEKDTLPTLLFNIRTKNSNIN